MQYLILLILLYSCVEKSPNYSKAPDPLYKMLNDKEYCYREHVYMYWSNAPAFGIDDRPIKCEDLK